MIDSSRLGVDQCAARLGSAHLRRGLCAELPMLVDRV